MCPYKGLAPYDRGDWSFFFGRERIVDELLAMAAETQFIAVIGTSGAGKSSLLRAGLLTALPGEWRDVVIRPGADPPAALRRALGSELGAALASLRRGERLLVAVDQFEEVFTSCRDERARTDFMDELLNAVWDPERRALIAIALRADFFERLAPYSELAQLVGASHVLLGPMNERELVRVVEGPCEHVGLSVEPALVAALVRDVAGQPGGLPLLSSAMVELWQKRSDGTLTFESYEQTEGLSGAVARLAERAWAALDADDRVVARGILLRMVAGGGEEPAVRRGVAKHELEPRQMHVVDVLTDARLLTRSGDAVEIAHEALFRHWPRLRDWLEEDAHGRTIHRHLLQAAADWEKAGREPSELYRGTRLAAALEWVESHDDELNTRERAFIDASRGAWAQERERARRTNRRLRRQRALAFALAAIAAAACAFALVKRHEAQAAGMAVDAEGLGAQALSEPSLDRSLLLARTGVALDDSAATRSDLLAALLRSPALSRCCAATAPVFATKR
jgi:energy-coupling factor transporter ATP-binding protein EcfA2